MLGLHGARSEVAVRIDSNLAAVDCLCVCHTWQAEHHMTYATRAVCKREAQVIGCALTSCMHVAAGPVMRGCESGVDTDFRVTYQTASKCTVHTTDVMPYS
jgi:hypothetical protein